MAIDFSYLEGNAPQKESAPTQTDTANVTIRVDADSIMLCDGDYIDQPIKAGTLTKIQLPIGQHLLEFLYTEDPDIQIEKEVDFPEAGKSYLVIIKGLKDLVDAAAEEVKRKAEEAARVKAEAEAKRIAEEEAKRKAEEEARRKAEEARVKAEAEAKRKAEEEAKRKAEEEAKCKAEEEAEAKRKAKAEAEAKNGVLNGHDYVDLGLPSGLKWATCNVGADSPERFGDYYAWGEVNTKSCFESMTYKKRKKRPNDISGNPTYDVARAKWGSSWRMPTLDEFQELIDECKWKCKKEYGWNKGYIVRGPNGNSIFLPSCGYRSSFIRCDRNSGYYWSSTSRSKDSSNCLHTVDNKFVIDSSRIEYGLSVRPVSELKM